MYVYNPSKYIRFTAYNTTKEIQLKIVIKFECKEQELKTQNRFQRCDVVFILERQKENSFTNFDREHSFFQCLLVYFEN